MTQYPAPVRGIVQGRLHADQDVTPGPEAGDRCPEESFGNSPGPVLHQTSGETKERTTWHVLLVWTSRARSASRSLSPTSSEWVVPAPSRRWLPPGSTRAPASATSPTPTSSPCATTSRPTSRSKVTSAVRSPPTSAARSRSAPTRACATVAAFPCVVSAPRPTRAPARARSAPSPARRRLVSNASQGSYRWRQEGAPQGEEERRPRARSHQEHVQQHHHLDHGPHRRRDLVGLRRPGRLQGLAQVHPVRGADGCRGGRPSCHGARHAQGRRLRQGPGSG